MTSHPAFEAYKPPGKPRPRVPAIAPRPSAPRNRAPSEAPSNGIVPELIASTAEGGFAKFRILRELGRGSIGVVHLGEDRDIGREVAIKRPRDSSATAHLAKFIEEVQITGQLEHPNIVPIHELGLDAEGRPWMAMKRVSGETLLDKLDRWKRKTRGGKLRPEHIANLLDIFEKVCDAIAFAHSRGVIHRDIKPENIMLGEFGEVMVMDWGLAKPLLSAASGTMRTSHARPVHTARRFGASGQITVAGTICGTPAYMPPEQARGDSHLVNERADIFALGAVLYHMLTFEVPFSGRTTEAVLVKAALGRVIPPRARAPRRKIPRELNAIVMRALAPEPGHRYPTVRALKHDIRAFQANLEVSAAPAGFFRRAVKWGRRHPSGAMAAGLSMMFVAVLLGLASMYAAQSAEFERRADTHEREAAARAQLIADQRRLTDAAISEAKRQQREATAIHDAQAARIAALCADVNTHLRARQIAAFAAFRQPIATARNAGATDWEIVQRLDPALIDAVLRACDAAIVARENHGDAIAIADWPDAVRDGELVLEFLPDAWAVWTCVAVARAHAGDADAAGMAFDRALQTCPNSRRETIWRWQVGRQ